MSFQITATAKDGAVSVTCSGDVPDGEFAVNGHEDRQQRTLSVTRRDTGGRYVQMAHGTHYKDDA